jgi:hypothetical protein
MREKSIKHLGFLSAASGYHAAVTRVRGGAELGLHAQESAEAPMATSPATIREQGLCPLLMSIRIETERRT